MKEQVPNWYDLLVSLKGKKIVLMHEWYNGKVSTIITLAGVVEVVDDSPIVIDHEFGTSYTWGEGSIVGVIDLTGRENPIEGWDSRVTIEVATHNGISNITVV